MLSFSRRSCARGADRRARKEWGRGRLRLEQLESRDLPSVYTPAQIRAAYGFNQVSFGSVAGNGSGQTIAIVDAYNDPNILGDVNTFDQAFGTGGSQTLYQQYGASSSFLTVATPEGAPAANAGWAMEISLDVEWAHAIAPGAKILLVEAANNSFTNLMSAVRYAASQPGVSVVSMSWGGGESSGESAYDSTFTTPQGHQGVTFVASSGDYGSPPSYPAVSPNVLAVGGTTLNLSTSGGYGSETAWSGSGGGLSAYESEPAYQKGVQSTGVRSNPDVSYNADPNSGYYVYDSVAYNGQAGWWDVGGTSAGAPQWAALIAIADQGRAAAGEGTLDGPTQTLPAIYSLSASAFHDITSGSNGGYSAGTGYDEVTGRGSPIANLVISGLVAYSGGGSTSGSGSSGSGSGSGSSGGGRRHSHHTDFAVAVGGSLGVVAEAPAASLSAQGPFPDILFPALAAVGSQPPALLDADAPTWETATVAAVPAHGSGLADGPAPVVSVQLDEHPEGASASGVSPAGATPGGAAVLEVLVPATPLTDAMLAKGSGDGAPVVWTAETVLFFPPEEQSAGPLAGGERLPPVPAAQRTGDALTKPAVAAGLAAALGGYWQLPGGEEEPRRRPRPRTARP